MINKAMVQIEWPNGKKSIAKIGQNWLEEAQKEGICIPIGCLNGSCGACEIDVNGKTIRACINSIENTNSEDIKVNFWEDPYW